MITDDLPWPELGNVSRGATRGNQGQKGVLSPPDNEGRCVLQLRVQPGVLAVRLNRQASEWYHILDNEVNRALKLTKTYWRKARRRQDYDARADQDHMELHEWLQQLKDKVMSHLELLMQKGDIQGPPYIMAEDIDLPFLKGFIERHAANIPHNPRLRDGGARMMIPDDALASLSDDAHDVAGTLSEMADKGRPLSRDYGHLHRPSSSYSHQNKESLMQNAHISLQRLAEARNNLLRCQKDSHDAFRRYSMLIDAERQARQEVLNAEKHRDDIMYMLMQHTQTSPNMSSRHSSTSLEERNSPQMQHQELQALHRHPRQMHDGLMHHNDAPQAWADPDGPALYGLEAAPEFHLGHAPGGYPDHLNSRKHPREWETAQPGCEDAFGPRKRLHHLTDPYDPLGVPIDSQTMTLAS